MRKRTKEREHTALEAATLAELNARTRLKHARVKGDAGEIAAAEQAITTAAAAVADIHQRRFEKNATMRGTTALTAIGDLAKLVRQKRYGITQTHVDAILSPLRDAFGELEDALNEAMRRAGNVPTRGIRFGNANGADDHQSAGAS